MDKFDILGHVPTWIDECNKNEWMNEW
jgi:hypothetical protein